MIHSTTFVLSREYFRESYDQARRYGSKTYLIERIIGALFVLLGLGALAYMPDNYVLPYVLVAIGIVELLSNQIRDFSGCVDK